MISPNRILAELPPLAFGKIIWAAFLVYELRFDPLTVAAAWLLLWLAGRLDLNYTTGLLRSARIGGEVA